jgi:CBS domain-containing protein
MIFYLYEITSKTQLEKIVEIGLQYGMIAEIDLQIDPNDPHLLVLVFPAADRQVVAQKLDLLSRIPGEKRICLLQSQLPTSIKLKRIRMDSSECNKIVEELANKFECSPQYIKVVRKCVQDETERPVVYKASDIMKSPVKVIIPSTSALFAWMYMEHHGIGHLPVVEDREHQLLQGLVTHTDLLPYAPAPLSTDDEEWLAYEDIGTRTVENIMVKNSIRVQSDAPLDEVAQVLTEPAGAGIPPSLTPIVDNTGRVKGVVSYLEVFENWDKFSNHHNAIEATAGSIGSPYSNFQEFPEALAVAAVTNFCFGAGKKPRHIIVKHEKGQFSVLSDRAFMPFMWRQGRPRELLLRAGQLRLGDYISQLKQSRPMPVLEETIVQSDMKIWSEEPDEETVISKFIKGARGRNWSDRLSGVLSVDPNGNPLTLITPADCIRLLLQ